MEDPKGKQVNLCPFGCDEHELDEHGYCRHLVGFTNDGVTFEPMKVNQRGLRFVDGRTPQKVMPEDVLTKMQVSSRVYRRVKDKEAAKAS